MILEVVGLILAAYLLLNLASYHAYCWLFSERDRSNVIHKKNVCLVTAHPDDECMFFGPILRRLIPNENSIFILCMTNGNYEGLGKLRSKELELSCLNMSNNEAKISVEIIDEQELPDHPRLEWNKNKCASVIQKFVEKNSIDIIFTFDEHGVSCHPNHCFLYSTVSSLKFDKNIEVYYLKTVSLLRKYIFMIDVIPTLLISSQNLVAVSSFTDYIIAVQSMMKHRSQLTWFRYLYISFSRYMLINDFEKSRA